MKNLLAIIIYLILPAWVNAQNLVPNGSFEDYTVCPTSTGQVTNRCVNWRSYTNASPDYFKSCATSGGVGVPVNSFGFQYAYHGNSYLGFGEEASGQYVEYIAAGITPMVASLTYEVSMRVSLANISDFGQRGLGIFFFKNGPSTVSPLTGRLNVTPQVDFSSYGAIADTANWVKLDMLYTADSAYSNIVIGSFKDSAQQSRVNITQGPYTFPRPFNYYYIDSVIVRLYDSLLISFLDTIQCSGKTISVPYITSHKKLSNNIFTLQLSDATGSFTTPVNIGSLSSDTSGTIIGTIPVNTPTGTNYRLRIVASNFPDTSRLSKSIKIGNGPVNFNAVYNGPLCTGETINLTASSTSTGVTYLWTGPNSFTSNSASPVIGSASLVHNGDYMVIGTFETCSLKDTVTVTVKPLPDKPIANNNTPLCAGNTLNLTASSSTIGVSWGWTGPNSYTSTSQNTNISNSTTAMSGDYIVTAELNGCIAKDTTTVLIKPMPAAVTTSSNTPLCAGDTLKIFSTTSSTGVTYAWGGPNSFAAATQNSSIANSTPAATGWYKMTVDLNGCTYKDSTSVTVYPIPSTPVASYSNPLCVGETLQLTAGNVAGASYSWTGANSFSSSLQNPTRTGMQFGDTGTYSVTATVNGCTSPAGNISIKINPVPFVVILSSPADSICKGAPVVFNALPNNHGGSPAYQWYVNMQPVTTGQVFSTTTLNNGDIIRCDMTENTKCSAPYKDESNDIQMTVLNWLAPSVSISANPATPLKPNEYVTFTATPTNAGIIPNYQWKRNGQNVVGATGAVWSANTLNDNDEICVEITSSYKCPQPLTAMSNCIKIKVLTGIGDMNTDNRIVLYPNPNNGNFVVQGEIVTSETVAIEVINAMGQLVYKDKVVPANGTLHKVIDLGHVAAGVYMLRLHTDDGVAVIRFNVE